MTPNGERTPFKPAVKHSSFASPPPSPLSAPASRLSRTTFSPQPEPSSTFTPAHPSRPLTRSNVQNLPSFNLQSASPPVTLRKPSPPTSSLETSNSLPSQAPRIRARVTPAASPRRKPTVPGAENAEPAPSALMGPPPTSPLKRSAPLSSFPRPPPLAPAPRSSPFASPFPALQALPEDQIVTARMASTSISAPPRERGKGGKDNVLVCVRVRPPAAKLAKSSALVEEVAWDVSELEGRLSLKTGGPEFLFDSVVTGSENYDVYQEAGKDLVLDAMEGFDAVIFAYGQTASGKTFTLSGDQSNPGIIPQAVSEIFTYIRDHSEKEFLLRASYLEIYNETLKDLLDPEAGPVKIRQDEKKRFFVHPLREEVVTTEAQVAALLRRGADNRHVGQTDFNERSSRSHSVFQMTIESRDENPSSPSPQTPTNSYKPKTPNAPRMAPGGDGVVRMSRLSLIDLAGSEQATSQMERRSEGAFINKSLLTLEKVIASLTDAKKSHVPYRDSKLTQILQPSLSGDARVAVIATCNPSPAAIEETKSTLKFAQRIKKVVLKAAINEVVDDKALITKYRSHIAMLEAQLNATLIDSAPPTPSQADLEADHSRTKQADRVRDLEKQVEEFRSLFLTSHNMEQRRQSALPPRPVSPVKMPRPISVIQEDERAVFEEKLLDAHDEISALKDERDELQARIGELEAAHLSSLKAGAETSESDKDAVILELTKENKELLVIARNADVEGELKRQERKYERMLEKCRVYEEGLEATLESERRRVAQFERFILQHLTAQTDLIAGRRRSSVALTQSASVAGFVPLMAESPDLDAISPDFVELDHLPFSKAGWDTIKRSGSRMFPV
ncbi:uncharacterized protein JCM6883_000184 [Sporobolomyces salmoneus]|uniref:uncharacterized protein n=1 Tax=Sporobolomyces salmoneus TaxID=183962 RepID=UPI00316F2944